MTAHFVDSDEVLVQSTQITTTSMSELTNLTEMNSLTEQRIEYQDALSLRGTPETSRGDGNTSRAARSMTPSSSSPSSSFSASASLLTSSPWNSGGRGNSDEGQARGEGKKRRGVGGGGVSADGRGAGRARVEGERLALRSTEDPPSYNRNAERHDGDGASYDGYVSGRPTTGNATTRKNTSLTQGHSESKNTDQAADAAGQPSASLPDLAPSSLSGGAASEHERPPASTSRAGPGPAVDLPFDREHGGALDP